ncbi:MAG: hypothetical protein M0P58_07420 [Bacteroidales bacterium]|nr:hypothetical protein [Bacteroidales bacterium]
MTKKTKKILIFSFLLLFSVVVVALGLKYFPFTRIVKLPASAEKEFANPRQIHTRAPGSLYFDFEVDQGKDTPGGMYKGIAHSGQYSVKAFGQNSYSLTIERKAGEIGVEKLKAVALSAWIYVFPTKNEVKGSFVFAASNELGVNVFWQGIDVRDPEIPRGKWFKVSGYFDMASVTFKPDYKLQVYFWNTSSADILIDDYYIVFGGPVDRRGDSALVDMTRGNAFVPRFNFPPWPVSFLEKAEVGKPVAPAEILPNAPSVSGNFLGSGANDLLTAGPDGKLVLFTFCPSSNEFRKVIISNSGLITPLGKIKKLLDGKFLSGSNSQFILCTDKKWALIRIEPVSGICSNSGSLQTSLKILWQSDTPSDRLLCGDFNGDNKTEVLTVGPGGTWKLMAFAPSGNTGGTWKISTDNNSDPIPEWNSQQYEFGMNPGRFIAGSIADVILTVTKEKGTGKPAYTFRKFTSGYWIPLFSGKQGFVGKIIGLDTLKTTDRFFTLNQQGGSAARIFRYNRDWRYDLKEIRFNDSTFQILSSVDFQGYDKDHNPKYYESLELIPGSFTSPSKPGFMVIGRIAKERQYKNILPDFTELYLLPEKKKN